MAPLWIVWFCVSTTVWLSVSDAYCPVDALVSLPLVLQYAVWRGWHQALIYTRAIEPGCRWAIVRLVKCLAVNGVASALPSPKATSRLRARLGIVVMAPRLRENYTQPLSQLLQELTDLEMTTEAYDTLIAARSKLDFTQINALLNVTPIRFDQNIVVAYPMHRARDFYGLCDLNFVYESHYSTENRMDRFSYQKHNDYERYRKEIGYRNIQIKPGYERNYYRTSSRFRNLTRSISYIHSGRELPLLNSGIVTYNYSRKFEMTNISRFSFETLRRSNFNRHRGQESSNAFYVVQYFKARQNSTLYAHLLGIWDQERSMAQVAPPYPVEARGFLGEALWVGRCNATSEGPTTSDDDGPPAPDLLDDVLHFLVVRFNATPMVRYYSKLGFRTYEGAWTGLLGALVERSVDLALEPVSALEARHRDMHFVFPIAETMCNIYIRHQETSTVRDIFLAPFSPRLLGCVLGVALAAAAAVVAVSRLAPALSEEPRAMGYAEALLWSTGILCQQGGSWTPPSPAASALLVVCLLFGVVTYNSYAAFITSVLSVRAASLDTVAAVLHSPDFKIGYIQNGADQMYLMSTKDALLNAFYIRGYSDAANLVSTATEGLARAATQDYAFFAGQRAARTALRTLGQPRSRCALRELPVPSTRAHLAFPLPRQSPYAKATLLSLVSLRGGGALARLGTALVPPMPQCEPPKGFASARATDVRSALLLLALGLLTSSMLGLGEYSWKNRTKIRKWFLLHCYKRVQNILR